MNDIDFIKWMVGYAEGFQITEDPIRHPEPYISVYGKTDTYSHIIDGVENSLIISLLLQKAIEGINRSQEKYSIQSSSHQKVNRISIYNVDTEKIELAECGEEHDIDEAKEQVLKYIWEQEKK